MNEPINIFQFSSSKQIDYVTCSMDTLLQMVSQYAMTVEDQPYFSSQMLLLSQSIEENRNGMDTIRISVKALDEISSFQSQVSITAHATSDK